MYAQHSKQLLWFLRTLPDQTTLWSSLADRADSS